jgi:predicted nucleic acid-binding protein
MGRLIFSKDTYLYLDTNIFIYAMEGFEDYKESLSNLFEDVGKNLVKAVTSELTIAEVLIKPIKDGKTELCRQFNAAIQSSGGLQVIPITRGVLLQAAKIRAGIGVRLPDAIHLATALLSGCNVFLTNDRSIAKHDIIQILYLSELISHADK